MAECWVDPENGSDGNPGTEALPWLLIPGQTGANAFAGGTAGNPNIINVRNGTDASAGGRVLVTANHLKYRGYGVASNVLELTLPVRGRPKETFTKRVVREVGVHEGMWTIIGDGTSSGVFSIGGNRSGVTVEDIDARHPLDTTGTVIYGAGSTTTCTNFTVRRSRAYGGAYGYTGSVLGVTLEDVLTESQGEEGINLNVDPTNGAGTTNTLRNVCVLDAGRKSAGSGGLGDAIQVNSSGVGTKRYLAQLVFDTLYIDYSSDAKQALKFYDGTGGVAIRNFHFTGSAGVNAVDMSCLKGTILVENGYLYQAAVNNPAFRIISDDAAVDAMSAAATVTIRNVLYEAPNGSNGFIVLGNSALATTVDGEISVEHNVADIGAGTPTVSTAALFSAHPGSLTTIGANLSLLPRNNVVLGAGLEIPAIVLPTGTAGQVRFAVKGNSFDPAAEYKIGASTYTTITLFEAAHSSATGNVDNDAQAALLGANFVPLPSSPLIGAGTHSTYTRDAAGAPRQNPPSIGAYEYIEPRQTATTRQERV